MPRPAAAPREEPLPLPELAARVVAGQSLFTAGHTLTTGGFFDYFVASYSPSPLWFAVLKAAPEFFETAGLFVRSLVLRMGSRKGLWLAGLSLGRLAALGIPVCGLIWSPTAAAVAPLTAILVCVALWYSFQGCGYVAYISWLSDLAPEQRWGRFFARQQSSQVATSLVVYSLAILGSAWARKSLNLENRATFYVSAFFVGGLVAWSSVLPLIRVPSVAMRPLPERPRFGPVLKMALSSWEFRRLLAFRGHLSLAQGLTQAVITKYQIDVLKISLEQFLLMHGLMLLLQTGLSLLAGRISDRMGDARALRVSSFAVGGALFFTVLATPSTWYLQFGAYAMWGLFGVVNLCIQTLALRLAPRSDNTVHLGLLRPVSGLLAALAGIFGGWWLQQLLLRWPVSGTSGWAWTGFQAIFCVSLLGRLTAPCWLIGLPPPQRGPVVEIPG